jgi:guanylate kinase
MTELQSSQLPICEPLLIVISGPSAVGKDSVLQRMMARNMPIHFVVTATSRAQRAGEQEGVDYIFVSKAKFEAMIARDELLEYALVYGEYKGIPRAQVQKAILSGNDVVMRIDVQGAATIRNKCPEAVLIFLTCDPAELTHRLQTRKSETPEKIQLRIQTAQQEQQQINWFDYVVENKDHELDQTVNTIQAIIEAEHHRVHPRKVSL